MDAIRVTLRFWFQWLIASKCKFWCTSIRGGHFPFTCQLWQQVDEILGISAFGQMFSKRSIFLLLLEKTKLSKTRVSRHLISASLTEGLAVRRESYILWSSNNPLRGLASARNPPSAMGPAVHWEFHRLLCVPPFDPAHYCGSCCSTSPSIDGLSYILGGVDLPCFSLYFYLVLSPNKARLDFLES